MSKMYVKDPNGKYRLVDKETQTGTKKVEAKQLSLEEIEARLRRLESIVKDPRKPIQANGSIILRKVCVREN
jgi:hypothetical protein